MTSRRPSAGQSLGPLAHSAFLILPPLPLSLLHHALHSSPPSPTMPYLSPRPSESSPASTFLPASPRVLPPLFSSCALTSPPLPVRRTYPIPTPSVTSFSPARSSRSRNHVRPTHAHVDSTEILRHGKHAQSSNTPQQSQSQQSSPSKKSQPTTQQQPVQAKGTTTAAPAAQQQHDMPVQGKAGQNGSAKGQAPMGSPNYREEAERIVAEERAQGEKMPVYDVRRASLALASH